MDTAKALGLPSYEVFRERLQEAGGGGREVEREVAGGVWGFKKGEGGVS